MDENNEVRECHCEDVKHVHKSGHWMKFALLLLTLFLACYLAMYYIMDQMRHAYYVPAHPVENIDRILNEQDRLFEKDMSEMGMFPMHNKALMMVKSPVETFKDHDTYKMIIDLKPFNNNPNNISVDVRSNEVSVSGMAERTGRNTDKVYSFSQSFVLPEKINTSKVNREKKGHKYIVTMPIDTTDRDIEDLDD